MKLCVLCLSFGKARKPGRSFLSEPNLLNLTALIKRAQLKSHVVARSEIMAETLASLPFIVFRSVFPVIR